MSITSVRAIQRCPRCGNENKAANFQCTFCGKRLRIEGIERVFIWRRIEDEWAAPYPWYRKLYYLFINSPRAFWDINHQRKKAPSKIIFFTISIVYAFVWMTLFLHLKIPDFPLNINSFVAPLIGLLTGFLFGIIYHFLLFEILIWLFTKGANYAVDYSAKLESRFGKKSREQFEKYDEAHMSPFSIYKGGVLQQKYAYKNKMMFCAFIPFIITYIIEIIVISIAFGTMEFDLNDIGLRTLFQFHAPVWVVIYTIEALTIMLWIPSLMAIAIRELSNSSTYRVVLSSYIVAIIVAIFYFFLRPAFTWMVLGS
ncbi:MAG: hypothetical protein ACFFBP_19140 [Promethearchaeota archaeon]